MQTHFLQQPPDGALSLAPLGSTRRPDHAVDKALTVSASIGEPVPLLVSSGLRVDAPSCDERDERAVVGRVVGIAVSGGEVCALGNR